MKKFSKSGKLKTKFYESEMKELFVELVKLQNWVKSEKLKVVVLFEGRDAAGKGAVIKKIAEPLNPRICRVVALGVLDVQLRPGEGPLHRPQQVQIGDIGGGPLLHKKQPQLRHRISLLPIGWRRRRYNKCGSPGW